jgi:hypothetical protein
MGWNSWNTFYDQVSEDLIRSTADAIVDKGLAKAGYEYVIMDDCWSQRTRDDKGRLVPNPVKFPNGIKAVADYVHARGLKLGIYSCCGVHTCAGYPGSYEKGKVIHGIDEAEAREGITVYHAGTALDAYGKIVTSGGRVLDVTAVAPTFEQARANAYAACDLIDFDGKQFRTDIGLKAILGRENL